MAASSPATRITQTLENIANPATSDRKLSSVSLHDSSRPYGGFYAL